MLALVVTGVCFSTVALLAPSHWTQANDVQELTETDGRSQDALKNEPVVDQPAPLAPTLVRPSNSVIALPSEKTGAPTADIASQPANQVRVRAEQVLAKVNDQAILLKHLVPLQPEEQEQALTTEEYESRLNRAIETELTLQAAAARGVDLTPEQKKRVDGIAQRHEQTLQQYQKQGVPWSSVTPTQVEFEKRLTSALMLQQNLVAADAHFSPASDPSMQARYDQARNEVLSRLKAKGNISTSAVGFERW